MKILVVEDEPQLAQVLSAELKNAGNVVELAENLGEGREKIGCYAYDLIVLDIGLPDGSGLELIPLAKSQDMQTGILILTAKDSLDDKIKGLELGADDYLTKPFHTAELLARLKALYRRVALKGQMILEFGPLQLLPEEKKARTDSADIPLTAKEFELLMFMAANENRVITKSQIAEHLWGDMADNFDDFDFIYAHMKNLRKKLSEANCGELIKTVYGIGYKFCSE